MDGRHTFAAADRCCSVAADTPVGSDIVRMFTSYLQRELRDGQFQIERIQVAAPPLAAMSV